MRLELHTLAHSPIEFFDNHTIHSTQSRCLFVVMSKVKVPSSLHRPTLSSHLDCRGNLLILDDGPDVLRDSSGCEPELSIYTNI